MTKHYKLPLKDKAALLNRFERVGVQVDSFDIKDNKLDDTFEFIVNDSNTQKTIDAILKQSPKIDALKEALRKIIREEYKRKFNK
jgi:5,10-methylene-tetrahydrofolate dehydrogenase/methenyl tetrahydrofolate cyclohydrolase